MADLFQGSKKINNLELNNDLYISDRESTRSNDDSNNKTETSNIFSDSTVDYTNEHDSADTDKIVEFADNNFDQDDSHNDNHFGGTYEEEREFPYKVVVHRRIIETTEVYYF